MTTQPHTHRFFAFQLARAIGLLLLLASALFAALLGSLSAVVVETAAVQAAIPQAQTLGVVAQKEVPPLLDERGVVFAENIGANMIQSVVLADMDGDGDLDIVTANGPDIRHYTNVDEKSLSSIQIHINDLGRFLTTNVIPITNSEPSLSIVQDIALGDVDNDGDLDLATGNLGDDKLYIMENLNVITTITLPDLDLGMDDHGLHLKRTPSIAWGDINGDGRLELALGNYGRQHFTTAKPMVPGMIRAITFKRDETENIAIDNIKYFTNTNAWTTDLKWADFDNNGKLDLIVGLAINDASAIKPVQVQLFTNTGDINSSIFSNPASISTYLVLTHTALFQHNESTLVTSADVDQNGWLDIAAQRSGKGISVLYDRFSVVAASCTFSVYDATALDLHSLAWGDVDDDGDLDLAVGFEGAPDRVYLNQKGCINSNPAWESEYAPSDRNHGTRSLAWGDVDNDGDLDLVAGGMPFGQIYYNHQLTFVTTPIAVQLQAVTSTARLDPLSYVALGDIDNDGDLDIARTTYSQPVEILVNDNGLFGANIITLPTNPIIDYVKLHFGDVDGNGFLDLYVAGHTMIDTAIYLNANGRDFVIDSPDKWSRDSHVDGTALGDFDNDGQLEMISSWERRLYVYDSVLKDYPITPAKPQRIELGDMDKDGDLDVATTVGLSNPNGATGLNVYKYQDGFTEKPATTIIGNALMRGLAWGDMNGDGYLDLAVATDRHDLVYLNQNGQLQTIPAWQSSKRDNTWRLAWGDVDGDGDLDLATTSSTGQPQTSSTEHRVYRNDHGLLYPEPVWEIEAFTGTTSIAWGDLDNDGVQELVTPSTIYKLNRPIQQPLTRGFTNEVDPRIAVAIDRFSNPLTETATITALAIANFHAMPFVREQPTIPVTFTLFHPLSQTFDRVKVFYSLNGGGQWLPALNEEHTNQVHDLRSSPFPTGTEHSFVWDVLGSNFFGQSDDVVIRIEAYPTLPITGATRLYTNSVPSIANVPYVASQTYPFRLRGNQVRVVDENGTGVPNTIVYQIPVEQTAGGNLIGAQGEAFRTDPEGYLRGRGSLAIGDQLLALAPQPLPITKTLPNNMSWASGLTDTIKLYHTNGKVTPIGVNAWISNTQSTSVMQLGLQVLQVSASNPLYLVDLNVALEWDASREPRYQEQLEFDLKEASRYLYDFTNGQMALGRVAVTNTVENWQQANVVVHATNDLRPYAAMRGIVRTAFTDTTTDTTFYPGQIHIGSVWNRYRDVNPNPGIDWPLILAHELGHYLFGLEDTYLGVADPVTTSAGAVITGGLLINIEGCPSAMGDVYNPDNTEFIYNTDEWQGHCASTLAYSGTTTSEWEKIANLFPGLITPTHDIAGPRTMPFAFTTVERPTQVVSDVLDNQAFNLKYITDTGDEATITRTSNAQVFLLRDLDQDAQPDRLYPLGSAIGARKVLLTHGVSVDDQLCAVDRFYDFAGCETMSNEQDSVELTPQRPFTVEVSFVTTKTVAITVVGEGLDANIGITAAVFAEYELTPTVKPLAAANNSLVHYTGTIELPNSTIEGYIYVWSDNNQYWEVFPYSIGGGPGDSMPIIKKADYRRRDDLTTSHDGNFLYHPDKPFKENQFYVVKDILQLPSGYSGSVFTDKGYEIVFQDLGESTTENPATDNSITGSVNFNYTELDALIAKVDEAKLALCFYNKSDGNWQPLPTYVDPVFDSLSARSAGEGIYAVFTEVCPE